MCSCAFHASPLSLHALLCVMTVLWLWGFAAPEEPSFVQQSRGREMASSTSLAWAVVLLCSLLAVSQDSASLDGEKPGEEGMVHPKKSGIPPAEEFSSMSKLSERVIRAQAAYNQRMAEKIERPRVPGACCAPCLASIS